MVPTADPTRLDRLFRAFADRTRRRILKLLGGGELCVGDLVAILRVPQSRASRHLAVLRRAALVRRRESGLWSFYSLAPAGGPLQRNLLAGLRSLPAFRADARRAKRLQREGGCCPK
jgi:ArsR family transcriptional regulator